MTDQEQKANEKSKEAKEPGDSKASGGKSGLPRETPASPAGQAFKRPGLSLSEKLLIGLVVAIVLFGAGGLTVYTQFYRPLQQQLVEKEQALQSAQEEIDQLKGQIDQLSPLDQANTTLESNLESTENHRLLLSARADVAMAMLALARDDAARARAVLSQTPATLETLAQRVSTDQQAFLASLQDRLKLAIGELESNTYAAQSDMDVLMNGLLELETVLNR